MPIHLGPGEMVLLLVIVLIVFGAGRLPGVLAQLGRSVRTFRDEVTPDETTKQGEPKIS